MVDCEGYRELIQEGYSRYFKRPFCDLETEAVAQAVDLHLEGCLDCREAVIALLRKNWRMRPNPLTFVPVCGRVRHLRNRPLTMYESTPIVLVVNTIFREAIEQQISEIALEPCRKGDPGYPQRRPPFSKATMDMQAIAEEMNQAVVDFQAEIEKWNETHPSDSPQLLLRYRIDNAWREERRLPAFIVPALRVRYKNMATLKVRSIGIHQEGRIPLRYRDIDYDVKVVIEPHPLGESFHLSIAREEQLAA